MGTQEVKLRAIADAIREKDGTAEPIPAADFPDRIRAISAVQEGLRTITVETDDSILGTVSGGGVASDGMTVTVSAVPTDGSDFDCWRENGVMVSESRKYAFDVLKDRALKAFFVEVKLIWVAAYLPSSPSSTNWKSVTYGNGKFVEVTGSSSKAAYSTNGINWTSAFLPLSTNWQSVTYGNGKFVAVPTIHNTASSSQAAYSTDGINWTSAFLPSSDYWKSVTYGNSKFVAVAGSSKAAYSTDGVNWTSASLPSSAYWQSVTYGNGKFVAVAENSSKAAYSTDGVNWISGSLPSSAYWQSVTYGNGKFVAVAEMINTAAYALA